MVILVCHRPRLLAPFFSMFMAVLVPMNGLCCSRRVGAKSISSKLSKLLTPRGTVSLYFLFSLSLSPTLSLWYITVMTIVLGLMTGVTPNVLRTHFGGLMARQSLLIPIGPYCVDPVRDKS
jgi:hypothetical protein